MPEALDDLETQAWRGYVKMRLHLSAHLGRLLQQDSDLSTADFEVLLHLSESPSDQMRVFELAEELQWERSRLSHQLTRMEGRGLVRRYGCPSDGRGSFVEMSAEGRRVLQGAAPSHVEAVRRHFVDVLDRDQLQAMAEISQRVLDSLP